MEAGEAGAEAKANILIKEFARHFRAVEFTMHPRHIPGEAQGKSSNLCWAARYVNGKYSDEKSKRNIIITVLDGKILLSGQLNIFSSMLRCTRSPRKQRIAISHRNTSR
jgi:hypothetical protein